MKCKHLQIAIIVPFNVHISTHVSDRSIDKMPDLVVSQLDLRQFSTT